MNSVQKKFTAIGVAVVSCTFFVTTVSAGNPQNVAAQVRGQGVPNISVTPRGLQNSCQARENAINARLSHLINLASTMERSFDAIATRVETYYTTIVLPEGKTVSNYSSLVSDIQTKKTAVQTALRKAQTDVSGFACTGGSPKSELTQFRVDMQSVISALKTYRTSIKNLIVAVHSVTGTDASDTTPKPTGGK